MISNKLSQIKQDMNEVKDKFEQLNTYKIDQHKDLKEAIEILEEHLQDHIEDVEIFIGRTN